MSNKTTYGKKFKKKVISVKFYPIPINPEQTMDVTQFAKIHTSEATIFALHCIVVYYIDFILTQNVVCKLYYFQQQQRQLINFHQNRFPPPTMFIFGYNALKCSIIRRRWSILTNIIMHRHRHRQHRMHLKLYFSVQFCNLFIQ